MDTTSGRALILKWKAEGGTGTRALVSCWVTALQPLPGADQRVNGPEHAVACPEGAQLADKRSICRVQAVHRLRWSG